MKSVQKLKEKFGIIGQSQSIDDLLEVVETAAPTNISILIYGESGSGKEVIANVIHKLSNRKHQSFVAINCGALPENLIDSELFGYEKGAFTGAVAQKKGLFEVADKGTIFLDELAEMPLKTQVRLLRVLESGELIRVGGTESICVDVRVIAATHQNLEEQIAKKGFRRDLYYRLKAITIRIPPLRDRREDIEPLINHFIKQFILKNHVIYGGIDDEAKLSLTQYNWPGNVRELKNTVETLIVLSKSKKINLQHVLQQLPIQQDQLPYENQNTLPMNVNKSSDQVERELIYQTLLALKLEISDIKNMLNLLLTNPLAVKALPISTHQPVPDYTVYNDISPKNKIDVSNLSIEEMERDMIKKALDRFIGNRRKAAQALNISERTLYRKIKEYNLG